MLNLLDRSTLVASLPQGMVCAEVGVASGLFSNVIFDKCKPKELFLIDCWEHLPADVIGDDPSNHPQHYMDAIHKEVTRRFSEFPQVHVVKAFSLEAAKAFEDGYFDWVYLDANHLQARQDAEAWWPKVKFGGWLMGHDYTNVGDYMTVKRDIDAWAADNGLSLQIAGLDSDDVYEKNYPSWCAKKP